MYLGAPVSWADFLWVTQEPFLAGWLRASSLAFLRACVTSWTSQVLEAVCTISTYGAWSAVWSSDSWCVMLNTINTCQSGPIHNNTDRYTHILVLHTNTPDTYLDESESLHDNTFMKYKPPTLTGFAPVCIQYSFVLVCTCTYTYVFFTYWASNTNTYVPIRADTDFHTIW